MIRALLVRGEGYENQRMLTCDVCEWQEVAIKQLVALKREQHARRCPS